jgi:predicted short-subunit dehydrogenase-like oxidoreductase (DUF2520 family)
MIRLYLYFCSVIRVVLIGSGNLAHHLHRALLRAADVQLVGLSARRTGALDGFEASVPRIPLGTSLEGVDICIFTVSDLAIKPLAAQYAPGNALFVHTSGAMGLDALDPLSRKGVIYPLQTFSKGREIAFDTVPICIEASSKQDGALLSRLARALSSQVLEIGTDTRRELHLAAVYLNNFSNHMIHLGQRQCTKAGLPEGLLDPLLRETFAKVQELSAYEAQTGPARRNDTATQQAHLNMLKGSRERDLYRIVSESIRRTYEQEL